MSPRTARRRPLVTSPPVKMRGTLFLVLAMGLLGIGLAAARSGVWPIALAGVALGIWMLDLARRDLLQR